MARELTVMVFTTRMAELARWYTRAVGLPEAVAYGDLHMGIDLGAVYLGFDQIDDDRGHGAVTLWFPVDDVDATFARCVELGAKVGYEPIDKPWGDRLAAVFDPDGNVVGLSQTKG